MATLSSSPMPSLALALGALFGTGCEFKIPAPTYIHQTRLISVQSEVVEFGPLNPERVGVPSEAPIAEAMPHDRLAFEAMVVDTNGNQLPADEVETIWFQCDLFNCGVLGGDVWDERYDDRCDDRPDRTMDDVCRLGEGDARFEFSVPELGPQMAEFRVAVYYGVVAWNGRSAEDCWVARRARDAALDDCGFIVRSVKIGPSWWLLVYADSIGVESPIPVWQIPAAVYLQAANRTPSPIIEVVIDGALAGVYPDERVFEAKLGSSITLSPTYDPIAQFTQTFFIARQNPESEKFWFEPAQEFMVEVPFTTNAVHSVGDFQFGAAPLDFIVDEYADPGTSRIFVVYNDDRFGEGVAQLDIEVGG